MRVPDWHVIPMTHPSQVGEARRLAAAATESLRFSDEQRGRVAIVATELGTNLVKHARGGEMLLRAYANGAATDVVEVLVLDRGPGIADVGRALQDGYSTTGSPGTGLGAVRRLADQFDLHSEAGAGTVVLARIASARRPAPSAGRFEVGAISLPAPREQACGDGWSMAERDGRFAALLVDGLGHGPQAAEAAREAERVFGLSAWDDPVAYLERAHGALRKTRGVAAAIALIQPAGPGVRFAGIGNIVAAVIPPEGAVRRMVSQSGILGHEVRRFQEFAYPWPRGGLLVLHSDGIATHWDLQNHPGLRARHPLLLAAWLVRDYRRERDDATVLVAREQGD